MRNSFHLSFIQQKGSFDKRFPIAGGTGIGNPSRIWKILIDFLNCPDGGGKRISVVIAVERVEQRAVLSYERRFGGGGTGIDTKKTVALIGT